MRIRQRDDRYRNKKKKKQQHGSSHHHQGKQLNAEPAYRRKPNPIRRYDTDVLSPVAMVTHLACLPDVELPPVLSCCGFSAELHPEFPGPAGAGAALPGPTARRLSHGGGDGLRLWLQDASHRSSGASTTGLTPPPPTRKPPDCTITKLTT